LKQIVNIKCKVTLEPILQSKYRIKFPPKTRTWIKILEVSCSTIELVGVKASKRQGGFEPHEFDLQSKSKPFTNLSLFITSTSYL
jgi:hypothetical protein